MLSAMYRTLGMVGRVALSPLVAFTGVVKIVALSVASIPRQPWAATRVALRRAQVHLHELGVRSLPPVVLIGLLVGSIGSMQLVTLLGPYLGAERVWGILIVLVFQELAPIWTAVVIASRSGTIVTSELAHMNASSELDALRAMGIDPFHYAVLPRFVAIVVATASLSAACVSAALFGGAVVAIGWRGVPIETFVDYVHRAIEPIDVLLFVGKTALFGSVIGGVAAWYGLGSGARRDRLAKAAGSATFPAVAACVAVDFVAVLLRYVRASHGSGWFA